MNKRLSKSLVFGITLTLITVFIIITVPLNVSAQPPYTVWVDDDYGPPPNPCGGHTWGTDAFDKIQNGINAVATGGTVKVYAGTYIEAEVANRRVLINKKLTLESLGDIDSTIIDGCGTNCDVIRIIVNDITIKGSTSGKGFTLKRGGQEGLELRGSIGGPWITGCMISDLKCINNDWGVYLFYAGKDENNYNTMENIICTSNTGEGFTLHYSHYNQLTNIKMYDNNGIGGIYLYGSNDNTIEENEINDNYRNGIKLKDSEGNTISDNEIYDNDEAGILLEDSDNNYIELNEIYNTATGTQENGIKLKKDIGGGKCTNNNIVSNQIYNNNDHGIYVENSEHNTIEANWIESNNKDGNTVGDGIRFYISDWNDIIGNIISNAGQFGNQQYGIYFDNSNNNDIQYGTDVYFNKKDGICFFNSNNNGLYESIISHDNEENGLHLINSDSNIIECNCIFRDNTNNGIYLEDNSDGNTIGRISPYEEWIIIRDNANYGIYFKDSGSQTNPNSIIRCKIHGNDYGIYFENSDYNQINNNQKDLNPYFGIYENTYYGIWFYNSNFNTIEDNHIHDNEYGIYLDGTSSGGGSDSNTIKYNTIEENSDYGVEISQYCNYNVIHHNDFVDNNDVLENPDNSQACDDDSSNSNTWYESSSEEGNYWSNYIERYPEAEDENMDGIWDDPYDYEIDGTAGATDDYPLVYPANS